MRNHDEQLLAEAYSEVYNEGIWDRVKGLGAGIKAGVQTGGQKLFGGKPTDTMGQSYAKAQQTSLLKTFVNKATKEIADFQNDLKKMGVSADLDDIRKTHPDIAANIDKINNLVAYLKDPLKVTPPAPTATPPAPKKDKSRSARSLRSLANRKPGSPISIQEKKRLSILEKAVKAKKVLSANQQKELGILRKLKP